MRWTVCTGCGREVVVCGDREPARPWYCYPCRAWDNRREGPTMREKRDVRRLLDGLADDPDNPDLISSLRALLIETETELGRRARRIRELERQLDLERGTARRAVD